MTPKPRKSLIAEQTHAPARISTLGHSSAAAPTPPCMPAKRITPPEADFCKEVLCLLHEQARLALHIFALRACHSDVTCRHPSRGTTRMTEMAPRRRGEWLFPKVHSGFLDAHSCALGTLAYF